MTDLENIEEWIDQAIRHDVCCPRFTEELRRRFHDMGGLNDVWALEVDQLQAKLAAAHALLREILECDEERISRLLGEELWERAKKEVVNDSIAED